MFAGLCDLVFHPDTFFERVSQEKVNLIPPVAIVGAAVIIQIMGIILHLFLFVRSGASEVALAALSISLVKTVLCQIITLFVIWGTVSLSVYCISRLFSGSGSLIATIQNTGYGIVPSMLFNIGSLIASGFIYIFFHGWPLPPGNSEWLNTVLWAGTITSAVFFFWQWYLWVLAVKHTCGFTFRRAAAVTIIPIVIVIWLTIPVQAGVDTITMIISGT